jgi:hypothetical protein
MMTRNPIRESEESRYRETQRMCRELRTERPGDYRDGRLKIAPPAPDTLLRELRCHYRDGRPLSITKPQQNMSNQKLEIKSTRTLFMKQRWRWIVRSLANGKTTGASSEKFSRRIDMADNARLILNADLVKQLDALLAELDA